MTTDLSTRITADFNGTEMKSDTGLKIIQIDQEMIKAELGEIVKGTVEETLNAMLDAEADRLCGAKKYERTSERKDYRCGTRDRKRLQGRQREMAGFFKASKRSRLAISGACNQ